MSGRHLQVVVPFLNARLANRGLTVLVSRHKSVVKKPRYLGTRVSLPNIHLRPFLN